MSLKLQRHLATGLLDAVGRNAEVFAGKLGVARHEGEHGFLDTRQMSSTIGDDIVSTNDIGGFLRDHILIDSLYVAHQGGHIDRLHEADGAMHAQ